MPRFQLTVLDEELTFQSAADAERIHVAKQFVEEQYAQLKSRGGSYGRNALLSLLILGIADDLLQSHEKLEKFSERITTLLDHTNANI